MGCGSSSNNAAGQLQAQQQQQQNWTNQATNGINQAFSGFNPSFYQQAGTNYMNWALPQVQQQFQQTQNNLIDKFAGQGIINSSAAQQAQNQLSGSLNSAQQTVANNALGQEQQLQQQVGQEESNLYNQALATNNPGQLGQQALQTAASTSAPSTFAPLGSLFNNVVNQYLGAQNAGLYNNFSNYYLNSLSNPAVFGNVNSLNNGAAQYGF